jgi:hypothetical protein
MLKDRHKKFLWWGKDGVPIRGAVTNVMFALPTYARRDVLTVGTKTKKRMVDQMQQESSGAVIPPLFHCAYWATFVQRKFPDALVVVQSWQWWSRHCVRSLPSCGALNRSPSPKPALHQNPLFRLTTSPIKWPLDTPNQNVLTQQLLQFEEGNLYIMLM